MHPYRPHGYREIPTQSLNQCHHSVSICDICLKQRYSNNKEPLQPHPIPNYPWQVVATELFEWDNKNFLLVSDFNSRLFEEAKL